MGFKYKDEKRCFYMNFINEYVKLKNIENIKLFRLTRDNENNKLTIPRIPDNYFTKNGYEENKTPRICFGPSIDKCLMALSRNCTNEEYYVHIPEPGSNFDVYKPTLEEVPDSGITEEMWVLEKINQICIGKVKVISNDEKDSKKFYYGPFNNSQKFSAELYSWKWEWIEKYNDKRS